VLEIDLKGSTAIVKRDIGSHVDVYEAKLPILACAVKGVNTPRAPQETDKRVKQVDASGMDKGRIGIEGSPTRVVQISVSERMKSYVDIDSTLSCEQRIECIINGGLEKKVVKLKRGTAACLAAAIWNEDDSFDLYSR
jgi:electron transfer flavoprotein alpha/beta subunit